MEKKDETVQWYEQLLMWEQGRVDAPRAPEGLYTGAQGEPPPRQVSIENSRRILSMGETDSDREQTRARTRRVRGLVAFPGHSRSFQIGDWKLETRDIRVKNENAQDRSCV